MDFSNFIWKIKKFGFENIFRRYYSIYTAQVVDNLDPEDRGRVKVVVPDILDDKELTEWAEPQLPTSGKDENASSSRTGGKFGSWFPPKIGDFIWVQFRMGDLRNPVYMHGGWWADQEKPDFLSDDRKNAIFISRYGHEITVDETEGKAKINIQSNKNYQIEINETDDQEQINIICGKSGNKLQFYDQDGSEYILLQDKNGDSWKWDIPGNKWEIVFNGDKEETIQKTLTQIIQESVTKTFNDTLTETVQKAVEQTFNATWDVKVSQSTSIESGVDAKIKQPQIAIGNGGIELLEEIFLMMTALGKVRVLTPVGPAAPMTVSPEWSDVLQEMNKIKSITGTF